MELKDSLIEICNAVASAHRLECNFNFSGNYPAVINSPSGVKIAETAAAAAGLDVKQLDAPAMSSEDFSCFLLDAPDGVFVRLGAGENQPPLHNDKFLPPVEILKPGIDYLVSVAFTVLSQK